MNRVVLCLLSMLLGVSVSAVSTTYEGSVHCRYGYELIDRISEGLCAKHDLQLTGTSTAMMKKIECLGFYFRWPDGMTVEQVRSLLVDCMGFIMEVAKEVNVPSQYVKGGQLSEEHFAITIISEKAALGLFDESQVHGAVLMNSKIKYRVFDEETGFLGLREILSESYCEACDKVAKSNRSCDIIP